MPKKIRPLTPKAFRHIVAQAMTLTPGTNVSPTHMFELSQQAVLSDELHKDHGAFDRRVDDLRGLLEAEDGR
jgi:hypothetical protein